jgi:hypothetical protein
MNIQERHVRGYHDLFVHRTDIHARQRPDGSYYLRMSPATDEVVKAHLEGRITAGWYALDAASTAKWAVLDADREDGLVRLQHCFLALDELGVPSCLERSRRGGHLWLFLEHPVPASGVRQLVRAAVPDLSELELYPKQDQLLGKKVGSLVRGPLGVHLLSGNRYPFVDPISLQPVARSVLATVDYLLGAERISTRRAAEIVATLQAPPPEPAPLREPPRLPRPKHGQSRRSVIEQVKANIGDPYAFLSRFIDLDERGRGHCPFHPPDHHKSFAINPATGKWTDFHEFHPDTKTYTGGDIIDFYARIKGISLKRAIRELL